MTIVDPRSFILEKLPRGTFVHILGNAGSGRTTLAQLLLEAVAPGSSVHVVARHDLHIEHGEHIEYPGIPAGLIGDPAQADVIILEEPEEIPEWVTSSGATVIAVTWLRGVDCPADITVLVGKFSRRQYEAAFGHRYPGKDEIHLPRGGGFVARRGEAPVLVEFAKPGERIRSLGEHVGTIQDAAARVESWLQALEDRSPAAGMSLQADDIRRLIDHARGV